MDHVPVIAALAASALRDAAAVLVPVNCAGCGCADRALCPRCLAGLGVRPHTVWLRPPARAGEVGDALAVDVSLHYEGVTAQLVGALKEHGRTDALPALVAPMRAALDRADARCERDGPREPPLYATMPSARRAVTRRGYRPVDALTRRAGRPVARRALLRLVRETRDQAGLGVDERRANLRGAMRASGAVAGRDVILVDDVITTGSTILEARRAVVEAGGRVIAAACLASTAKRKVTSRELVGDTWVRPY